MISRKYWECVSLEVFSKADLYPAEKEIPPPTLTPKILAEAEAEVPEVMLVEEANLVLNSSIEEASMVSRLL